jgi:hypothetical protein
MTDLFLEFIFQNVICGLKSPKVFYQLTMRPLVVMNIKMLKWVKSTECHALQY